MHTPRPLCTVALSQAQHHHHHHHSHSHNDHHCAAGRQAGRINEPNDNTINYKNSPQFICVCRGFIYVYEQLPPSATSPPCTHCTPSTLYHCRTVPLSHCPQPPMHLSLIMFDCCHCSRTFHGAGAPGRQHQRSKSAAPAYPKAAALESNPNPNPNRARIELSRSRN